MSNDTSLTSQRPSGAPQAAVCDCGAVLARQWTACGVCGRRRHPERCVVCRQPKGDAGHWMKWGQATCPANLRTNLPIP